MSATNRLKVFGDDFVELDSFAHKIKKHPRTIKRWTRQPDGLPFATAGNLTILHLPTAREWLLARMKQPNPRR
jgi:hypothetical protein